MQELLRLLIAPSLVLAAASSSHGEDWPQWLGVGRAGVSAEKGIKAWGPKGPPIAWQKDVGEGYSGPVVAGERLIVFHRVGDDDVIECWHAATGKSLWRTAYPTDYRDQLGKGDGPRSTPCIAGERVVAFGAQGILTCLELASGKKLWQKKLHDDYRVPVSYFGVGTSPLVVEGLVLVNVGGKGAGIVAFSLEDGKEAWKATSDGASYSSPVLAEVGGAKLAIFFTRNGPVILDPKSGAVRHSQRWRANYDASVNAATPLVIGDLAFFSTSYETGALFLKLRKDGADEVWSGEDLMTNHYNTCVVHDGHLYGFDGRQEAGPSFRCVNIATKKIAWDKKRFGCGSMVLVDGKLLVLLEGGELLLLEATPKEYRELARARILDNGPCRAQIALANGKLYARDSRKLACVQLKDPSPGAEAYSGPKDKLHIFVLVGQSNMSGRAKIEAEDQKIPKGLFLLDGDSKWAPATHPFIQYTNVPNGADLRVLKAGGKSGLNFGLTFARRMLEADPDATIGLAINSQGGSSINTWKKGATNYTKTLARLRPALATGVVKGVLWHQGEADLAQGEKYLDSLKEVIAQFREDLGQPNLPFIAGQLAPLPKDSQRIGAFNAALLKLPKLVPHTGVARADDLSGKDIHFDAADTRKLGQRYAEEMLILRTR